MAQIIFADSAPYLDPNLAAARPSPVQFCARANRAIRHIAIG